MERMKDGLELMKRTGEDIKHSKNLLFGIIIKFI
jgi:hypothetical protein